MSYSNRSSVIILHALQSKHIYTGTVPPKIVEQRRRRNKAARIARRNNR